MTTEYGDPTSDKTYQFPPDVVTAAQQQEFEAYNAAQAAAYFIEGFGFEVTIHSPCPFCSHPDFHVYRVLEVEQEIGKEHVCRHCGRGSKTEYVQRDESQTVIRMVQTRGDDPPAFLKPYFPRAAEAQGEQGGGHDGAH